MFKSLFNRNTQVQTQSSIKHVSAAELNTMLDSDEEFVLIDVRSPREYQHEGHVRGARLLPLQALSHRTDELPKDKTVVCICRSGARSYFACEQLVAAGFESVVNVNDGMIGWKMAGYAVQ
ncbi:MAG: sulfurtransferase [Chloroflexi bacterium]|nr:MAG: sulfurtransferase [Chloroflexota bacterium]